MIDPQRSRSASSTGKKSSRRRKSSTVDFTRIGLIGLCLALAVGAIWGVAAYVMPMLNRRPIADQVELHQHIEEARQQAAVSSPFETIRLVDGQITFQLPTDHVGSYTTPYSGPTVDSMGHHFDYVSSNSPDYYSNYLRLGYETVTFRNTSTDVMAEFMLSRPPQELLADNDVEVDAVVSDTNGDWNGCPYRDFTVSGQEQLSSRYRSILIGQSIAIFTASWSAATQQRAQAYFDSIEFHAEPFIEEAEAVAERPRHAVGNSALDLMPLIDLDRDATTGKWIRFENGIVTPPETPYALLVLPIEPPASYELRISLQRTDRDQSLNIGLPVGESTGMLVIDGFEGLKTGLSVVGGVTLPDLPDVVDGPILGPDISEIVIQVTPQSIHATCDGDVLVDWNGDPHDLSIRDAQWKYEPHTLFIGSWHAEFLIHAISIRGL